MREYFSEIKEILSNVLKSKTVQGYDTANLITELESIENSYDKLFIFSEKLADIPYRKDWKYVEPDDYKSILKECDKNRSVVQKDYSDKDAVKDKIKTAFYSSVCGCILGKPLEEFPLPDLYEMKDSLRKSDSWPLNDYVSVNTLEHLGRRNISWTETTKNNINFVAEDDDITYTIIGMLLLETKGINFTKKDIKKIWIENLPIYSVWGPERTILLKSGLSSLFPNNDYNIDSWPDFLNPGDELCGALIRADAYGYACPGNPELAAKLAYNDSSFTHRKTGIYGSMFIAAAISTAFFEKDPMKIFETALKYIPQKSRFYQIAEDSLNKITSAKDWESGYDLIHNKYKKYGACQIYQEIGTVMNTLKFAENIGDGICKQVMQGNDTDSFGATCGSLLGAYFGPEYLESRWLEVFNDDIYTSLSNFKERKLSKIAERMANLPEIIQK